MRVKLFYNLVVISFVKCNPTPYLMYVLRWPPDGSFIVGSMWWWQFISLTHLTGSWFIICFHNTASLYSSKPVNLKNCPKSSQHDGVILITSRGIITKERWNPNQKLHHKYSPLEVQITSIVILTCSPSIHLHSDPFYRFHSHRHWMWVPNSLTFALQFSWPGVFPILSTSQTFPTST